MSTSPGVTSFPCIEYSAASDAAMLGCSAAIFPPRIATSITRSRRWLASRTLPPLITTSYFGAGERRAPPRTAEERRNVACSSCRHITDESDSRYGFFRC